MEQCAARQPPCSMHCSFGHSRGSPHTSNSGHPGSPDLNLCHHFMSELNGCSIPLPIDPESPIQCTMSPLSTRNCFKSSKVRPISNCWFCRLIYKKICLNVFESKQRREKKGTLCSVQNNVMMLESERVFDSNNIRNKLL